MSFFSYICVGSTDDHFWSIASEWIHHQLSRFQLQHFPYLARTIQIHVTISIETPNWTHELGNCWIWLIDSLSWHQQTVYTELKWRMEAGTDLLEWLSTRLVDFVISDIFEQFCWFQEVDVVIRRLSHNYARYQVADFAVHIDKDPILLLVPSSAADDGNFTILSPFHNTVNIQCNQMSIEYIFIKLNVKDVEVDLVSDHPASSHSLDLRKNNSIDPAQAGKIFLSRFFHFHLQSFARPK